MANRKMSHDDFVKKVKDYHGNKVEILSDYKGTDNKIKIIYHCELHGDTYTELNAKNICKDYFNPCKKCQSVNKSESAQNQKKDKIFYYNRLKEYCESKDGKLLSKEWTKAKDYYEFKCSNPNHPPFKTTADALYSGGHWCPYCSGRKGNFEEELKNIIESKNGEMLSGYINSKTPIKVKCKKHNYVWKITSCNLKKGRWCPICSMCYNEKVLYDIFKNNNINIIPQYTFEDLQGETNELLKFDFGILDDYGNLKYLIEVDDEEHNDNHKSERRIIAKQRDFKKDKYCKDNEIKLYRMKVPFRNNKRDEYGLDNYQKYIKNYFKELL